jgi:integrase
MAGRPRKDGSPSRVPNKRNLTELFIRKVRSEESAFNVWDAREPGLVLRVQPSGHRAFKAVYSIGGRARWYHIGNVGLADARRIAQQVRLDVAHGKDPAAERRAERNAGTFAELAERYVNENAKKKNRSWAQADYLVRKHLLPRLGKLNANAIMRKDVRAAVGRIDSPTVANQTLAAASAVFSWGVKQECVASNPCKGIERNATKSRERILSDSELPLFWAKLTPALRVVLLTGQRPGEVSHMRREHIIDGWWKMPGAPVAKLGWPGTKNKENHDVWLTQAVREIVENGDGGFVFRRTHLDAVMRDICQRLGVEDRITPHDLRRTFGTMVTRLGLGRPAMDRILNHRDRSVGTVYDRHAYAAEDRRVMETVAAHILALAEGRAAVAGNVVSFNK